MTLLADQSILIFCFALQTSSSCPTIFSLPPSVVSTLSPGPCISIFHRHVILHLFIDSVQGALTLPSSTFYSKRSHWKVWEAPWYTLHKNIFRENDLLHIERCFLYQIYLSDDVPEAELCFPLSSHCLYHLVWWSWNGLVYHRTQDTQLLRFSHIWSWPVYSSVYYSLIWWYFLFSFGFYHCLQ